MLSEWLYKQIFKDCGMDLQIVVCVTVRVHALAEFSCHSWVHHTLLLHQFMMQFLFRVMKYT